MLAGAVAAKYNGNYGFEKRDARHPYEGELRCDAGEEYYITVMSTISRTSFLEEVFFI